MKGLTAGSVGIGLKSAHVEALLSQLPPLGYLEVHAENYMVDGGPLHDQLQKCRAHYPLSLHGVALSMGGEAPLDKGHLGALKALVDRYQPAVFSEHLAWSSHQSHYQNDLLPLPYTRATLQRVCDHIDQTQHFLGLRLLLENPSTYVEFASSHYTEPDFISEVVKRTGCGLLLDVNNVYVSCTNHHWDSVTYLNALPLFATGAIHLAGFDRQRDAAGDPLLIDHHGAPVDDAVWELFRYAQNCLLNATHIGPVATTIEWDNHVPTLDRLVQEAMMAKAAMTHLAHE